MKRRPFQTQVRMKVVKTAERANRTPESSEHEAQFIASFIAPEKRQRYASLLRKPQKRQEMLRRLAHHQDFVASTMEAVPPAEQTPEGIRRRLVSRGAPEFCYVLSENDSIDGITLGLGDALKKVVGYGSGSVVSCVPGRLAYFEAEEASARWLLVNAR